MMKSLHKPRMSPRAAFVALLAVDMLVLPVLIVLSQVMPITAIVGGVAVMLVHPVLFFGLGSVRKGG